MPIYTYYNINGFIFKVKYWFKNNCYHRNNSLPAVECNNGDKLWYKNDICHRDNDLPSIEFVDGSRSWYKNGECHRDNDMPAIEWSDGNKSWYKNNIRYFPNKQVIIIDTIIKIKIIKMSNKWWYIFL